jgi:DNA-binding transcriptional MerR regulator
MRAREIRELLDRNADPKVLRVLEALAEQQGVLREQIMTLAEQQDQMLSILNGVVQVAHNMKSVTDRIQGKDPEDEFNDIEH